MCLPVRSFFAAALPLLLAAPLTSAAEPVALKWKLKAGQTWYYTTVQDTKMNLKQGVVAQEMLMKQTSDVRWSVESIDEEGNARATLTMEHIRSESGPADDTAVFDSADEKLPEGADESSIEAMRAGLNEPIYLVLDPTGKVLDVRLSDEFSKKIKESPQYGQLAGLFSRENLKQMVSANTIELPAEPLAKGDTWERQSFVTDPLAGKLKLSTTYRYDGLWEHAGQRLDKISTTASVSPAEEQKLSPLTVKDQKMNGVVWFDRGLGRIAEMSMSMKVASELSFGAGASKLERIVITSMHSKLSDTPPSKPRKKPDSNAEKPAGKPEKAASKAAEDL